MYFTKISIKDFGKFHSESMDLKPGINLVVGDKESGKTTIKDFIVGMIYGIHKREGITEVRSDYEKRKPQSGSEYAGAAYIKKDGVSYLVERSFLAGAKNTSVMDIQSGREVRLNNRHSLFGTLTDTDKNSYIDTKIIEEADPNGENGSDSLRDYLTNLTLTGSSDISKAKAIAYLENEKKKHVPKPLVRRLDELDKRIAEYDGLDEEIDAVDEEIKKLNEDFNIEVERRKREARKLIEGEDGSVKYEYEDEMDQKLNQVSETVQKEEEEAAPVEFEKDKEKQDIKFTDRIPVILGTGVFVVLVITAIVYMIPFEPVIRQLFVLFTAGFVVYTIIDGLIAKGVFVTEDVDSTPDEAEFKKVIQELKEEAEKQQEIEIDMEFANVYQENKRLLKEKEDALLTKRRERNLLRAEFDTVFKKKSELEDEVRAIDFAINKINQISEKYKEISFNNILGNLSEFLPTLSRGKFDSVTFDDEGRMIVTKGDAGAYLNDIPKKDMSLINLAARLSISKHISEDSMPLIIDGTDMLDSAGAVKAFAECLVKMNEEQIIVLTEDSAMPTVFSNMGLNVNKIQL